MWTGSNLVRTSHEKRRLYRDLHRCLALEDTETLLTPVHPGHRPWKGLDRPAFVVRFLVPRTMKKYVSESEDPRR